MERAKLLIERVESFVTADRKFADKLDKVGLGHLVMRLGDAKPTELTKPIISDEDLKNVVALSARYNETIASVYRQLKSPSEHFSLVASQGYAASLGVACSAETRSRSRRPL
jgi:hypothetical protein